MSPAIRLTIAGCLLAASLSAQGFCPIATLDGFVPDNQSAVGTCNTIPFGTSSYTYLARIPASYFNASTPLITDVAFASCSSGSLTFSTIQVAMGHVPNPLPNPFPFPSPNLSTLGGMLDATMMYDSNVSGPLVFNFTQDQWSPMNLVTPFVWNGVDDVGFFITYQNSVAGGGFGGSMHRTTTEPTRTYATGYGAATATTTGAASGLKMRITGSLAGTVFETAVAASPGGGGALGVINIPPGTTEGFTLISAATTEPRCFGPLAGIYPDVMTWDIFAFYPTALPGNPLHWVTGVPAPLYPAAPFIIPTGALTPFIGSTWDFLTIALGPNFTYLGHSTVARTTWL